MNYTHHQLLPAHHLQKEDWIESSSDLTKLSERAIDWPEKLLIFHSVDDFFVGSRRKFTQLKSISPDKVLLYRNGGHLGYLWSDRFRKDLHFSLEPLTR